MRTAVAVVLKAKNNEQFQRVKVTAIKKKSVSVNVFSTKVLIGDTFFDGRTFYVVIRAARRSSRSCSAKGIRSFLSYFKTLSTGPAPGIEPATSHSAVKRALYRLS